MNPPRPAAIWQAEHWALPKKSISPRWGSPGSGAPDSFLPCRFLRYATNEVIAGFPRPGHKLVVFFVRSVEGQLLFHDLALHASLPNRSGQPRRALIITYRDLSQPDQEYPSLPAAARVRG